MTRARSIVAAAIVLGLLSMGFGSAMRLEKLHNGSTSPPNRSVTSTDLSNDRLALVIGNANYPDAPEPLRQVTRNTEALASALRQDSFQVDRIDNATRADLSHAIDELRAKANSSSIVLLYFAGYGIQSDGQNYLIPIDAKIWTEKDVRQEGVSIDDLLSYLKTSAGRACVAIIEASRRNPYERRFRAYSRGLAPIRAAENTVILSSAAPDQVVQDSDGLHSRLMTALLAELNNPQGIERTLDNTREEVAVATQGHQIPALSSTLAENISLWR